MDLFDNEELFKEEKKKVKKKGIIIISCIVVAILLIIGIVVAMMYFQSLQWGITVDGVGVSVKDTTIITDEQTGKVFISIADVAPHVTGYTYLHGEYGKNSEDNNSGVVQCNDEAVEFHANQNKINKVLLKEDTNDNEYGYMYLSEKIKYANGQLYAYVEDLQPLLNAKVNYNQATNKITLAGTEYLYEQYQTKIASLGYNAVDSNFVNKKALASDMIVAQKENGLIGSIDTISGKTGISEKNINRFLTYNEIKEDISGDYSDFRVTANEKVNGTKVIFKGGNKMVYLIGWTKDGQTHGMYFERPITRDMAKAIVANTVAPKQHTK